MTLPCPRRQEVGGGSGPFRFPGPEDDHWKERSVPGWTHCSWCGSLNPDEVLAAIEARTIVLGPTDKPYKAYVESAPDDGRDDTDIAATSGSGHVGKFYFQHFSVEQRRRFIDLYNERRVRIGYPGHFYVLPFFARRDVLTATEEAPT